jgi:uncharacterized protein (TIGR02466 family)|tara:strand:+ start:141 stop:800 length:660 start_codon:yes stop_codon:yes gene_type:complete
MTEQIPIAILNWGPCVVRLKIKEEFKKLLLDEGKKCTEDYTTKLAGILDKEVGYGDQAKKKILPTLSQYIGVYDQAYQKFVNKPYDKMPEYVMSALWINYQKPNDFNPPHDHDGKLSFVIYLGIPDELKAEHATYKGKSCGPGGIQFIYGNGPRDAITYMSFFPEEGDMFIFPAWLKHWVAPYKSDCTRISVSGNFHDTAPINNIHRFAPKYLAGKEKK